MASRINPTQSYLRVPLGDGNTRLNTGSASQLNDRHRTSRSDLDPSIRKVPSTVNPSVQSENQVSHSRESSRTNKRLSTVSKVSRETSGSRRVSRASTGSKHSSCDSFPNKKTHIGPWQLGKTLGKGSSARVRAARHSLTHQPVAVKIVPKRTAQMTQAGSLVKLDAIDMKHPDNSNGDRRMPLAIEREVAILKLIEHPNIVKLYDIWENRNEIYLILEFVERGDLFEYINRNGRLTEEQTMFIFRQMMSAIEYCHYYNICHRDLKPENILLKSDGQVKVADFGMAALHQGEYLETSCGSPHYAAPELLKARPYRGEKTDIWSMGCILFAMMAARLPFDDERLDVMLAKAKKGIYVMPEFFSNDAKDLIHRILQVDPVKRISMKEMWQHPLVWKYGYLDELRDNDALPLNIRGGKQSTPLTYTTIDTQIFRQLRSMWHTMSDRDLMIKLMSEDPNDQKMFYWLLYNYRERQLENYNPNLTHSTSDYHLLKPANWSKRVSTRQFAQPKGKGHGRSISKFTVISNVAEAEVHSEGGTVRSYDPYNSTNFVRPRNSQVSHAKVIVHRGSPEIGSGLRSIIGSQSSRATSGSGPTRKRLYSQCGGTTGRLQSPRSSMSSIQSSRQGTPRVRPASRYRRGVDFSNIRKPPADRYRQTSTRPRKAPASIAGDETTYDRDTMSPQSPRKRKTRPDQVMSAGSVTQISKPKESTLVWNEELMHFSNRIAKDCDDAFMNSLLTLDSLEVDRGQDQESPFSLSLATPGTGNQAMGTASPSTQTGSRPWDLRPLPPPPPQSPSKSTQLGAMQLNIGRDQHNSNRDPYATPIPSHTQNPLSYSRQNATTRDSVNAGERRIVSAPVYAQFSRNSRPLPSIYEAGPDNQRKGDVDKARIVSAPAKSPAALPTLQENMGLNYLAQAEHTIRVVHSPSVSKSADPVAIPQPLKVRKKLSTKVNPLSGHEPSAMDLRQQYTFSGQQPDLPKEPDTASRSSSKSLTSKKKMISWFRRSSKSDMQNINSQAPASHRSKGSTSTQPNRSESQFPGSRPPQSAKKKSFLFPFWKSSKSDPKLSLAGPDHEDTPSPECPRLPMKRRSRPTQRSCHEDSSEDSGARKIEPQQNWLARLFHVKPAMRYLCLAISKRRARQEIAILLREWRQYGIRDVEVDKERNIVFARVSARNYLNMKEVAFACEIMTVIEHGKRSHLSIIRFTQEKGAASSFHKVVGTVNSVFVNRNLLVTDKRKAKMMIKTLNS